MIYGRMQDYRSGNQFRLLFQSRPYCIRPVRQTAVFRIASLSGFDKDTLIRHIFGFEKADIRCVLIVADDAEQITEDVYQALRQTRIPAMFITTQYDPHMDFDSIYVDETRGIRAGVEYLTDKGYKKIGFIGEEMTRGRLNAFRQVMYEDRESC